MGEIAQWGCFEKIGARSERNLVTFPSEFLRKTAGQKTQMKKYFEGVCIDNVLTIVLTPKSLIFMLNF